MGFSYAFVTLNEEQFARRREFLDYSGSVAQGSALTILFAIYFSQRLHPLLKNIVSAFSVSQQKERQSPVVSRFDRPRASAWAIRWRRLNWYLDNEVVKGWSGWGTKREWIVAGVWTLWLLTLVFIRTGKGMLNLLLSFSLLLSSRFSLLLDKVFYTPWVFCHSVCRDRQEYSAVSIWAFARVVVESTLLS